MYFFWLILEIFLIFFTFLAIFAENPVYSILFLAGSAIILSIFFILFGAEFIGLMFGIVYIGAIIILFLFIVMLLNLDEFFLFSFNIQDFFIFVIVVCLLSESLNSVLFQLFYNVLNIAEYSYFAHTTLSSLPSNPLELAINVDPVGPLGIVLYEKYVSYVLLSGLLLLVILMGVVLLLRTYEERASFFIKANLPKHLDLFFLQPVARIKAAGSITMAKK